MIALRANVIITGSGGARSVPIDEFFMGFYTTAVSETEILTELSIPTPSGKSGNAYHKLERKVGDYATAGVAVSLSVDDEGTCTYAGIGLTNVNATPLRASRSEEALLGSKLTDEDIAKAAQYASEDCNPSADLRGSEEYKRAMVDVLVKRIVNKAKDRI